MSFTDSGRTITRGLLQGSPLSPLLSNLYLTSLDDWLESQNLFFCRYADDIVICFRTKQEADAFYPVLVQQLKVYHGLEINPRKSGVLETARQQFLGYAFKINQDGRTAIAYRAKHSREIVYRDWRQEHIKKIDQHYHIVNEGIISKKDYNLLFESDEGKRYIPVETMGALNIYSDVVFSSVFFCFAAEKHLYVSIFDKHGNMMGSFIPADNGYRSKTMLRQSDIYLNPERRLRMAKAFELGAFHNLRSNLRYYSKVRHSAVLAAGSDALTEIIRELGSALNLETLLLLEARGHQVYYSMFNEIIREPAFAFTKRTRRPPLDPLNALISFGNTYLYQRVATEINKTALDIRIGYLHSTNKRSQSLNLDIAELFKPLVVDRAIFTLINKKQINVDDHFETVENGGIYLSREGKRIFIRELDSKVYQKQAENDHPISYDTRIRNEVRKILRFVNNGEEYEPYKYY